MTTVVIIPFRDRGTDPLRTANLARVRDLWTYYGLPVIIADDGRDGDAQFNRSAAYNRGVASAGDADVFVFAESDMLIAFHQIEQAIELARVADGLVIPFTEYRYLGKEDSAQVRVHALEPFDCTPQWTMNRGRSVGALNVISRDTYDLTGGFDESFEGNWYDDDAAKVAFEVCAGPTRWIEGPACHLYHLPGHMGSHLTTDDKMATLRNRLRLRMYRTARTPAQIHKLTQNRCAPMSSTISGES